MVDKKILISEIIAKLREEEKKISDGLESTRRAAVEAPGAMQSHSDTTKSQMGYLAADIQKALEEKKNTIVILESFAKSQLDDTLGDSVQLGSIVEIEGSDGSTKHYFILPAGGGTSVVYDNKTVWVTTPSAPLAANLLGKKSGDEIRLQINSGIQKEIRLLKIREIQ